MTDLTPLFQRCVDIVSSELGSMMKPQVQKSTDVSDTFAKECAEVYLHLVQLARFVGEIRPVYLQVQDEFSRFDRSSRELSTEDKSKIDEEFKLKIQQMYEKLKMLQAYERKRSDLAAQSERKGIMGLFQSEEDSHAVQNATIASHRTQMLRFLSDTTNTVNKAFENMQRKRYNRERQMNLLHFQNLDDDDMAEVHEADYQVEIEEEELPQQQLQELVLENKELLTLKTNQFKQVEKLHSSMVDIVKLQTELTMHLESQAEQIDNLLDNQDQVEVDLRLGNRTLSKATERNKRGSNIIVTTCFVLGFLILFVDYIS